MSTIERAITLGLDQSRVGKVLINRIRLRNNKEDVGKLEALVRRVEEQAFYNTVDIRTQFRPSPTADQLGQGDFSFFRALETNDPVLLRLDDLDKGAIISGKPGKGKTTFLYALADALMRRGIPVVIFTQKTDGQFERLKRDHNVRNILVGVSADVPNPFELDSGTLSRIVSDVYGRKDSRANLTLVHQQSGSRTLQGLMLQMGKLVYPSDLKLNKALEPSLNAVFVQISEDALGKSLLQNAPLNLKELVARCESAVINTSQCAPNEEELEIVSTIALMRKSVPRTSGLRAVVIIDEGTRLVARRNGQTTGIADETRLARGDGLGIFIGTHNPSTVDITVGGSQLFSVVMNMTDARDVNAASAMCSLTREQEAMIPHIPVGQAIFRQSINYTRPFIITWDPVPPGTPVDLSRPESVANQTPAAPVVVDDPATKLLKDVAAKPFLGLVARCKGMGMDWRDGKKIADALVTDGVCTVLKFQLNQRGQPPEFLFLTDSGYQRIGVEKPTTRGGTGVAHTLIQRWVKETLAENNVEAVIEDRRNGKSVDVGLPAQNIAIEIVLSTETTEPRQAQRDLESWGRVVVLCPNREVLGRVQRNFEATGMTDRRVAFSLPWDLMQTIKEV